MVFARASQKVGLVVVLTWVDGELGFYSGLPPPPPTPPRFIHRRRRLIGQGGDVLTASAARVGEAGLLAAGAAGVALTLWERAQRDAPGRWAALVARSSEQRHRRQGLPTNLAAAIRLTRQRWAGNRPYRSADAGPRAAAGAARRGRPRDLRDRVTTPKHIQLPTTTQTHYL